MYLQIPSLFGNLGGLMGLYIGMSFISVFEIGALVLRLCKIGVKRAFCKNDVTPDEPASDYAL